MKRWMVLNILVIGMKTNNMVMELKFGNTKNNIHLLRELYII